MKKLLLILLLPILFSCNKEEDWRKHEDCFKLDNLDEYVYNNDMISKEKVEIFAFNKVTEEWEEYACGLDEAFIKRYNFNCDNYPDLNFNDFYLWFGTNGTPCGEQDEGSRILNTDKIERIFELM